MELDTQRESRRLTVTKLGLSWVLSYLLKKILIDLLLCQQTHALCRKCIDYNISEKCRICEIKNICSRKIDLALLILSFILQEVLGISTFNLDMRKILNGEWIPSWVRPQ